MSTDVLRLVSWNTCKHADALSFLLAMEPPVHVGLLQEVPVGSVDRQHLVSPDSSDEWSTIGWEKRPWRTAVVRLADGVDVDAVPMAPLGRAGADTLAVSRWGTLAAATLAPHRAAPITVASVHSVWERPVPYDERGWIYADGSAHRLIADVAGLIDTQREHRVIVAGDFNLLYDYGEGASSYWAERYRTVFAGFQALGLDFVGPYLPSGSPGPVVDERPSDSRTVPTFRRDRLDGATASRQLDFVFASRSIASTVQTTALVDDWGPSDHCRVLIELPV